MGIAYKAAVGCAVFSLSDTRWSARVECVRPIAAHLSKVTEAVESLLHMNLTAAARHEIKGILKYLRSFKCILMSSIWLKVLVSIDHTNKVLQAREATIDVEVDNLGSLLADLKRLREG